jgi:enamine deaminase RidA (YjgF/YER057c/UK114 family)
VDVAASVRLRPGQGAERLRLLRRPDLRRRRREASSRGRHAAPAHEALDNLETVLGEAGLGLADVVRLDYYTTGVDALFESYDAVTSPLAEAGARVSSTLLGVTRLAHPALLVEIEATAAA